MDRRQRNLWLWVRILLVAFVAAWILGPSALRDDVPILVVFAIALGLELHFLFSALRGAPARVPDRRPLEVDRARYGFDEVEDREIDEVEDEAWVDDVDDVVPDEARSPVFSSPIRRFALGVGLIVALGAVVWLVQGRTGWSSLSGETRAAAVARFSKEASVVAGKPVAIRCDEARDYVGAVQHADGVAVVGGDLAILTPEICDDLYRLAFQHRTTGSRTGRAISVLAHEAWHLRGVRDEGTAECFALQAGVALGERLGLSERTARQLMRQQLTENALRGLDTLEYRLPEECRNGGRLDLHPAGSSFP